MQDRLFSDQRFISEVSESAFREIENRMNGIKYGLPTGWPIFDDFMGGAIDRSRQIVIAGRPGEGKTTLKNILQLRLAKNNPDKKFVFVDFSFEMRSEEHFIKNLSYLSKMDAKRIKSIGGKLSGGELLELHQHGSYIKSLLFFYHDIPLSSSAIRKRLIAYRERYPEHEIVVSMDHVKLGRANDSKHDIRRRVSDMSGELSSCKQELGTINFLISQLGRAVEQKENIGTQFEPELIHLSESGSLEEDADTVIMLHRPDRLTSLYSYDKRGDPFISWWNDENRSAIGEMKILIKKNRYGDNGVFNYFSHDFSRNSIKELPL